MELYKYLWWQGNSNLDSVLAHFEDPLEELDGLLAAGRISIHRADYGKVWISCPAFHKGNAIEELIESMPGITAGEIQEKLKLSRQQFYERINGLELKKVKDGRKTRYYLLTHASPPAEGTEEDSEPFEGSPEAFRDTLDKYWKAKWDELVRGEPGIEFANDKEFAAHLIEAAEHFGLIKRKKLRRKS